MYSCRSIIQWRRSIKTSDFITFPISCIELYVISGNVFEEFFADQANERYPYEFDNTKTRIASSDKDKTALIIIGK